jgi:hypothetical protein
MVDDAGKMRWDRLWLLVNCLFCGIIKLEGGARCGFTGEFWGSREALIYSIENSPTMLAQSVLL